MNDRLIAFFLLLDTMLAAGVVIVLICAATLTERILKKTKGDAPGKPRITLTVVLFASFVILSLWILNHYWLPHKFHPLSLVSDLGLLVVFALVGYLALAVAPQNRGDPVFRRRLLVVFLRGYDVHAGRPRGACSVTQQVVVSALLNLGALGKPRRTVGGRII